MRLTLARVNLLLYATIVVLGALYWDELRWAREALPEYVHGDIDTPRERSLDLRARALVGGNTWEREQARSMLEESLAIDPHGEAGYWLAELSRREGRTDEALAQYAAYLRIDPVCLEAYLMMSAIHERAGRPDAAAEVLRPGLEYFASRVARYRPVDDGGNTRFDHKARDTHEFYRGAATLLRREIERLGPDRLSGNGRPRARGHPPARTPGTRSRD